MSIHNQIINIAFYSWWENASYTHRTLSDWVQIYILNGERAHLKHMYGLLLDWQHSQDVPVEVEALVVGQDDLVTLKGPGVTQPASVEVDNVEGVVL